MTTRPGYTDPLHHDDAAVLKHMEMYQNIISRMAGNSSACKHWCILLVSAFLAFIFKKEQVDLALLGAIPIIIFCFLDAYYLGLENKFRQAANESAQKIRESKFYLSDLFVIKADGRLPEQMLKGFSSWATWPVYSGLLLLLLLILLYTGTSVLGEN